ncbi:MAG TPA: hypothetical protein VF771_17085 [Longimicrobiaceae bacterium]
MSEQDPKAQVQDDEELSAEELEDAAGGLADSNSGCTSNGNCPCSV